MAPNGIIYVKPEVRKGLLGRMLTELLDTRIMVKHAMKGLNNKVCEDPNREILLLTFSPTVFAQSFERPTA